MFTFPDNVQLFGSVRVMRAFLGNSVQVKLAKVMVLQIVAVHKDLAKDNWEWLKDSVL